MKNFIIKLEKVLKWIGYVGVLFGFYQYYIGLQKDITIDNLNNNIMDIKTIHEDLTSKNQILNTKLDDQKSLLINLTKKKELLLDLLDSVKQIKKESLTKTEMDKRLQKLLNNAEDRIKIEKERTIQRQNRQSEIKVWPKNEGRQFNN